MTVKTPIDRTTVDRIIQESGLQSVGKASIREIKKLVDDIEDATGNKFVRMEMGVPGIPPTQIGVDAEIAALKTGVASIYPDIYGIKPLKPEISRFVKNFLDVSVSPEGCIPTVGSMQGSFATFITVNRRFPKQNTTLFIDPGFPVHKQQLNVLGLPYESFDVYNYRGDKLRTKLETYLEKGNISSILYSNPNNPSWICFTEDELRTIAELADKYNVIILEDLAYIAMDFRIDLSQPGVPPFQPSVAKYTDNYILFISSSKAFSYAGQRIGMMVISDKLYQAKYENLQNFYSSSNFGAAMIFGTLYSLSSGTSHSAQYALAAMLKAANEGQLNFVEDVKLYGERARVMKKMFIDNGFEIVSDPDGEEPIADGFYFTISYPGIGGADLIEKFVYYGISAISLAITGSERLEGLRACVSLVMPDQYEDLKYRLEQFHLHHPLEVEA
jgi:aspartate/methionine/tyrosine aminotransferase